MRLVELNIDGFGLFTGYTLSGLKPGVNIIFGENEAGKSTLLQFIRFTLFGYPRPLEQRLPPQNGGRHGGRVNVLLNDGAELVLERTAGYPGDIQLYSDDTTTAGTQEWSRLIGHASGDLFENVYAISLNELTGLESLNHSGVEDRIFSLGLGLKNISVNDIERNLTDRMEAIYKPRGSKQTAIRLAREISEYNREIEARQLHLPQYQQLSRDIDRHQEELGRVEAELSDRQSRYDRLSAYGKCYPSFVIIRDADRELAALPEWRPWPENGAARLEQMEQEEARLRQVLAGLRDELAAAQAGEAGGYNEALAGRTEEVEALSRNLEKYKTWAGESGRDRADLDDLDQSIARRVTAIGTGWTKDAVLAFTDMVTRRDRLTGFKQRLETLQGSRDRLDTEISLLKARRSPVHVRNACLLIALCLLIGAAPLLYDKNYLWAGVLILISLVVFFGRKLLVVDAPLREALQASALLETEKAAADDQLQRYLGEELGLPPALSPEAALETLRVIEQLGPDIAARNRLRDRLNEKERFLKAFEAALESLARISSDSAAETDKVRLAGRVLKEHKEAVSRKNLFIQKQKEVARLREAEKKAGQALALAEEAIDRLLTSIQAEDRVDFKEKYRMNARVGAMTEQRRQAVRTIEQIAGVHDSENVIAYLAATEKPVFEKELAQAGQALKALMEQRDEWNRKISADMTRRDQLRAASSLAEIMTRVATCRENLNRCHQEWLAARIARQVVQQVKQQYEQQKQPAIIRNSSDFFRRITGGRYQRIQVSLEDSRVLVFDQSGAARRIDQLSRGTREQLLISIRLGFIEEYEKKTESLPLVLDEILVNFDRKRAERTAALLHEFSQNRQTLLFTCHPETEGLFQGLPVNRIAIGN
ncbi:MAG: AAA family ATPase [Thermodesulfobacteriota bacterium]